VSEPVDLDQLDAATLMHLAHARRAQEEAEWRRREERVARAAELLDMPALGFYRKQREQP
jgi:hypothetical protein